ncbi:MAG: dephospho-CoA kinase [Clostridia bacterium]|nr:dephospho-CoA kinase [Clostridia bacterium]
MYLIGLTGGIASGKSTAAAALRAAGAPVVDADALAREVVEPGRPAYDAIVRAFGPSVVRPDGRLDRAALGRLVFADEARRRELEAIVHPAVGAEIEAWLARQKDAGAPAAVLEIPLLFESGWDRRVDESWVIDVPVETQVERLVRRDGLSREEARARVAAQLPREERLRRATRVFFNDGDVESLKAAVTAAWREVLAKIGGGAA